MHNADGYSQANGMQKRDALEVLNEFIDTITWSSGDVILDIGCGTGDVTANILLPKLPKNISRLIGGDISNDMVNHAKTSYDDPKMSFIHLDIASKHLDAGNMKQLIGTHLETDSIKNGMFDKLFSFYCLHWVTEQKLAMKNMYNLIKPKGECLVVFLANCPVFELYESLAKKTQWKAYMKDVLQFVSPYQNSSDPRQEFIDLVRNVGFEVITCRTEKRSFPFGTTSLLKKALKAVNPFVDRIPIDLKDEYLDDCVNESYHLNLVDVIDRNNNVVKDNQKIQVQYEIIIAHFRKM